MVQLNTTYDSTLKQKIFVLKGDEAYARTTDVIATLITDFSDYNTKIDKCHVGLEIEVLRELGDSTLYIYDNDELLYSIPWSETGMDEIIDEDWNDKGVYWDDDNHKLVIGKKDDEHDINTGLFLLYDIEHNIKVQYLPNERCLGSHAKPIIFTVPTPDTFVTTLSLTGSTPPVYALPSDVTNLGLLLECGLSLTSSKDVRIYDGDTLLTTVTATQDTLLTVDLSSYNLSQGLHTIKAIYDGDEESYGSETSLDISIGYVPLEVEYPTTLITGQTGSITATIKDYFGNAIPDGTVKISKYSSGSYTDLSSTTSSSGEVSFTNVALTSDPWVFTVGNWHSGQYTTSIIAPNNISISLKNQGEVYNGVSVPVTGKILNGSTPIQKSGVPITVTYTDLDDNVIVVNTTTDSNGGYTVYGYQGAGNGVIDVTASITGTQISNSMQIHDYSVLWNNQLQIGNVDNYGTSLSKQSNGYKFIAGSNGANFVFNFSNSSNKDYTMEFDVISANLGENDIISGIPVDDLAMGITDGDYIKITAEWQTNNYLYSIYVNNQLAGTTTTNGSAFFYYFANKNEYLVLNFIKIERTG